LDRAEEESVLRQYGVIPYRREADGKVAILLITSRETKRWVIPRGNPIPSLSPSESAAREAYEEAGIEGAFRDEPLGSYTYDKRRKSGLVRPAEVAVFPMEVTRELGSWPEAHERERRWFDPEDAADAVDEQDLAALFLKLRQAVVDG